MVGSLPVNFRVLDSPPFVSPGVLSPNVVAGTPIQRLWTIREHTRWYGPGSLWFSCRLIGLAYTQRCVLECVVSVVCLLGCVFLYYNFILDLMRNKKGLCLFLLLSWQKLPSIFRELPVVLTNWCQTPLVMGIIGWHNRAYNKVTFFLSVNGF